MILLLLGRTSLSCCLFLCIFPPQVLLHVLYEHASGYALFGVKEVEEISMLLPQVSFLRLSASFLAVILRNLLTNAEAQHYALIFFS